MARLEGQDPYQVLPEGGAGVAEGTESRHEKSHPSRKRPSIWLVLITLALVFVCNALMVATELSQAVADSRAAESPEVADFFIKKGIASIKISLFLQTVVVTVFILGSMIIHRGLTLRGVFMATCVAYALYLPLRLASCGLMLLTATPAPG